MRVAARARQHTCSQLLKTAFRCQILTGKGGSDPRHSHHRSRTEHEAGLTLLSLPKSLAQGLGQRRMLTSGC